MSTTSIENITSKQHAPLLYGRKDDKERGRYLVANCPIPKGRLIFCERPLVALQSLGNPVWVCHACKAFVGGPSAALEILATQSMPDTNDSEEDKSWRVVPCRCRCGQVYCSKECEADFWANRHQYLCTGRISFEATETQQESHPLIEFKKHAVATNEIFLLVAEWIVAEYSYQQRQQQTPQYFKTDDKFLASNPFQDFLMEPWWAIEDSNDHDKMSSDEIDENNTKEILKYLCQEACNFWDEHLSLTRVGMEDATPLHMANIIGACELNAIGIRRRNPLCRDIASNELRQAKKKEVLSCLRQASMLSEDEEGHENDTIENKTSAGGGDNKDNDQITQPLENVAHKPADEEEDDEWSYTDDDVAGFLAGLDIYEEECLEKSGNETNANTANTDDSQESEDEEEDHEHSSTGGRDDFDILFPPMDGTAMYALCCKMNHSCEPNVVAMYKTRGWGVKHPLVVHAVALRDIEEGEELCISYIDSDEPLERRQEALRHYGFTCNCSKCQRELSSEGGEEVQETKGEKVQSSNRDEDVLFGSDDSDSDGDEDAANAGSKSHDEEHQKNAAVDGEAALEQTFERLDTVLNHASLGAIPLQYLAHASAFVIQTAATAQGDLHDDKTGTVSSLLKKCVHSMQERDFVLAQTVGADLESVLFCMLKKESKWPNPAYREAYWTAAVTASVGFTHQCSFLAAIAFLDKALILGLVRQSVGDFFSYVEQFASQMAIGPCPPALAKDFILDYTLPEYRKVLRDNSLSQPIQYTMPEYTDPNEAEIQSSYVQKSKPVAIRQYARDWPAIQKWRCLTFFCRYFGHRLVPIELGSMTSEQGMKEELMTVREFVSTYLAESAARVCWTLEDGRRLQKNVAYLAQHPLIHQLPELGSDIEMKPTLCGELGPSHVYLWIGTGGTRTPLHFDSYSNIFVQLVGVKYVRIYGEDQTSKLYVSKNESCGLQGNMSDVDCEQEDFSIYPFAKDAIYEEVLLTPGDALFIPARAWHYVRSLSTSVSVNFWF